MEGVLSASLRGAPALHREAVGLTCEAVGTVMGTDSKGGSCFVSLSCIVHYQLLKSLSQSHLAADMFMIGKRPWGATNRQTDLIDASWHGF